MHRPLRHGPAWHSRGHVCTPHGRAAPQGAPQVGAGAPQGMPPRTVCPPAQGRSTGAVHGGQGPAWHLWSGGCPQGRGRGHGSAQSGGGVPHGSGGARVVRPQGHASGASRTASHGGHGPGWQSRAHACCPHASLRPQVSGQRCSGAAADLAPRSAAAGQHGAPHLWRPQARRAAHFRSQRGASGGAAHATFWLVPPQRQWTMRLLVHGGQGPSWHVAGHLCWGVQGRARPQTPPQTGTGSVQCARRCGVTRNRGWAPHAQCVTASGRRGQGPQSPTWQRLRHLCAPQDSRRSQGAPQEKWGSAVQERSWSDTYGAAGVCGGGCVGDCVGDGGLAVWD